MTAKVYLVGAGPGDPGLVTLKAYEVISRADVIIYDRLVDPRIVAMGNSLAKYIFVGKTPFKETINQSNINALLSKHAQGNQVVVRLKGGDPFLFGRGGEEALYLNDNGIKFEVIPGITSAIAAPAYAGIPITHRGIASAVTIVTGSDINNSDSELGVQWEALLNSGSTLVILMGWNTLPDIMASLISHGVNPNTPAALIQWGTEPYQRTITGSIANLPFIAKEHDFSPPVVLVIGNVVTLRGNIRWFDVLPLFGKRILVTCDGNSDSKLSILLQELGAQCFEVPTIKVSPISNQENIHAALRNLGRFKWVVFTSPKGVENVFTTMRNINLDARCLATCLIAAIGDTTALALNSHGISADLIPNDFTSRGLLSAMSQIGVKNVNILLLRSKIADDYIPDQLRLKGATVTDIAVYDTIIPSDSKENIGNLLATHQIDILTFTSASTVNNFYSMIAPNSELLLGTISACIGPATASAIVDNGLQPHIIAKKHTSSGLALAIRDHFSEDEVVNNGP